MASDSGFGRDDDAVDPDPGAEGVRLLGADEVAKAAERAETAKRRGPDEKKYGDRPEPPPTTVKPAMRFPLADASDPNDLERPRPAPVTPPTADDPTGSRTVLSVGPPTGEQALPHWTEPATGEVPRVLIGEDGVEDEEKWAAFAAASPRWRDENSDWDLDEDNFDFMVDETDDAPLGALDETERPMDEEFLTFDDLDVPDAAPPQAPPRGSATDPIKIQRSGRSPLSTTPGVAPRPTRIGGVTGSASARAKTGGGSTGPVPAGGPVGAPAPSSRDRRQAVQVGLIIAGVALAIFLTGIWIQWVPLLLIAGAIYFALKEFYDATVRAGFRPLILVGLAAGIAMPFAAYNGGSTASPSGESGMMLVLFLCFAAMLGTYLLGAGKGRLVANLAVTFGGVFYVAALGSYGALILRAGPWANDLSTTALQGVSYFILVALGTSIYDAGGYLLGSRIGRTPLSKASPNKTVEGLIAGVGCSFAIVFIVGGVFHLGLPSYGAAAVLGLVIAAVAPLGDLFESMIKRDLGVKDMGSVLPAHGGVLDRLDAYLFTLPAAYYTLRVLGLVA